MVYEITDIDSSIVSETIGKVLDFFIIFFFMKKSYPQKKHKKTNKRPSLSYFYTPKKHKTPFLIKSIKSTQATFAQIFLDA